MSRTKTFKTLGAFMKAIAPLVNKKCQHLILPTLEKLEYVDKEITHHPYKVSYRLNKVVNQEDAEKVANTISRK